MLVNLLCLKQTFQNSSHTSQLMRISQGDETMRMFSGENKDRPIDFLCGTEFQADQHL
jgi:hypothetical protein